MVNERGEPIGEELTVALAAERVLSREKGLVVVNLSTTKTVEDIARRHGAPFARAGVGEINVVEQMRKKKAIIGGEGNGGVIAPEVHLGRDSLVGIAYILELMARRGCALSELVASLPSYVMKKGKVSFDPDSFDASIVTGLQSEYAREKLNCVDGLRIDFVRDTLFKGGWVHLRPSNTEPIFRIIAEGRDREQVEAIYGRFAGMFS